MVLKMTKNLLQVIFHCHKSYYPLFLLFLSSNIVFIFACNSRYKAQCATGVIETISPAAFEKHIVCLAVLLHLSTQC